MARPSLQELGGWAVSTCLLFGASAKTAHLCASAFVEGIEREWADADAMKTTHPKEPTT